MAAEILAKVVSTTHCQMMARGNVQQLMRGYQVPAQEKVKEKYETHMQTLKWAMVKKDRFAQQIETHHPNVERRCVALVDELLEQHSLMRLL